MRGEYRLAMGKSASIRKDDTSECEVRKGKKGKEGSGERN